MKNLTKSLFTILLGGAVLSIAFSGCQKGPNDYSPKKPLPDIGGFGSSQEVASSNLVAYWPFDNTTKDSIGNLNGTSSNTSFGDGIKGNGFQGSANGSLVFNDAGAVIPAMKNFTLSFWLNAQAPKKDDPARGIFSLNNKKDFWGNLDVYLDGYRSLDTMNFKVHLNNDNVNWKGQFTNALIPAAFNKWVHMSVTYNDTTSVFNIYANGVKVAVSSAGNTTMASPVLNGDDPATTTTKYGPLKFVNANAMVIGSWQFQTTPSLTESATAQTWATGFGGALDNFRIYNRPLTTDEVKSLYLLEKAGR